jgi:hypothetical protein
LQIDLEKRNITNEQIIFKQLYKKTSTFENKNENKSFRNIIPCKDLLLCSLELMLLNPNPFPCLLLAHQIAIDGELIFHVIEKMEISRSIF